MKLTIEEIDQMQKLLSMYKQIICYTDGSSKSNPGFSGAGVAFAGLGVKDEYQTSTLDNTYHLPMSFLSAKASREEQFLFGLSLHLGKSSNNYAEYAGLILG